MAIGKRVFDLAVASAGIIVCSPILAVTAIAVRLDSPGPALFRQERMGRFEEPFTIHKFRSMSLNDSSATLSATGDPRVTRVGAFLRESKLDELPQLFDVVRGKMSLVGPRPELRRYVELWPQNVKETVLSLRPGVTDPASIVFRDEGHVLGTVDDPHQFYIDTIMPQKLQLYIHYSATRTFKGDLRILFRTFGRVARM